MNNIFNGFNVSIFKKVMAVFGIIVFSVYIMFITVIDQGRQDLKQKNIELTKSKVEFAFNSFEQQILSIREQQNYLINSTKLGRLINDAEVPFEYDQISTINELKNSVSKIMYSGNLVSDSVLYLPTIGKKISPLYIEDLDMNDLKSLLSLTKSKEDKASVIDNDIVINIMSPFQHFFDSNVRIPYALISVRISKDNICNYFGQFFNENNIGYAIFLMPQNRLIASNSKTTDEWEVDRLNNLLKRYEYNVGIADVIKDGGDIYYAMQSPSLKLGFFLKAGDDYFYKPLMKYSYLFFAVSAITFILMVIFFIVAKNIINKPITCMIEAFNKVESGNFELNLQYNKDDEFKYLYKGFNNMINCIRDLIHQVYEQRLRMQEAELKQLQYQINPHFLYNSLFVLYEMIKFGDEENAMEMARHLSNYYQYITKNKGETIPLEYEFEHVKNYIEILNFRYAGRITVKMCTIPEKYKSFIVPRLIVQPVIENAYKHGLKNIEQGGLIEVRLEEDDEYLRIFVEDNGTEISENDLVQIKEAFNDNYHGKQSTGLANVNIRLRIMYGNRSGLFVSMGKYGGLCVEMRIQK